MAETVITNGEISVRTADIVTRNDAFSELHVTVLLIKGGLLADFPHHGFGTPNVLELAQWLIRHSDADEMTKAIFLSKLEGKTNPTETHEAPPPF